MHTHSIDDFRHSHVFLGEAHDRNERKTWAVIAICAAMMVAEIIGGFWFGSVARLLMACTCPHMRALFL
jgi:Co/Zn/Cd efflux system component